MPYPRTAGFLVIVKFSMTTGAKGGSGTAKIPKTIAAIDIVFP